MGCVSILYPLHNETKYEYWLTTIFGPGMLEHGLRDFPGVVCGWEDVEYARRSMKPNAGGAAEAQGVDPHSLGTPVCGRGEKLPTGSTIWLPSPRTG